jgi:hypothetical protein
MLSKTNKYKTKQTNHKKKYQKEKKNQHECTLPIDIVFPKLSNYLAFQSFDLELPDECYSRNVHVH